MNTLRRVLRVLGRPRKLAIFATRYLWSLAVANVLVASEVISPGHRFRRGIVRVPIASATPMEVSSLSGLITFTPGTMTVEVDLERSMIYVHVLHPRPPEELVPQLQDLEARWLELIR